MKIKNYLPWLSLLLILFCVTAAAHAQSAVAPADTSPADLLATPAPGTSEAPVSFLQLLVKGGIFMIPIAALSLLSLALIIERFLALRVAQVIPPGFPAGLKKVLRSPDDVAAGLRYCHEHPSPIGRVIIQGLRRAPQGESAIEDAVEDAGAMEVAKLRRNLRTLHGISAIAPMLGLVGSVWGLIQTFQSGAAKGFGHPEYFATGIYEALIATLAGLSVAIVTVAFYYVFLGKIDDLVGRLNDLAQNVIDQLYHPERSAEPLITAPINAPAAPVAGSPATA